MRSISCLRSKVGENVSVIAMFGHLSAYECVKKIPFDCREWKRLSMLYVVSPAR
jgi:hypothetical protein